MSCREGESQSALRAARLLRRARKEPVGGACPEPGGAISNCDDERRTRAASSHGPGRVRVTRASSSACFSVLETTSLAAEIAQCSDAAALGRLAVSSRTSYAAALGACATLAKRRHGVALPEVQWTVALVRSRLALASETGESDETPLEVIRFFEARDAAIDRRGPCFAACVSSASVCGRASGGGGRPFKRRLLRRAPKVASLPP